MISLSFLIESLGKKTPPCLMVFQDGKSNLSIFPKWKSMKSPFSTVNPSLNPQVPSQLCLEHLCRGRHRRTRRRRRHHGRRHRHGWSRRSHWSDSGGRRVLTHQGLPFLRRMEWDLDGFVFSILRNNLIVIFHEQCGFLIKHYFY